MSNQDSAKINEAKSKKLIKTANEYIGSFLNFCSDKSLGITTIATVVVALFAIVTSYQSSSLIDEQRREFYTLNRAYISISTYSLEFTKDNTYAYTFLAAFENSGNTPANFVSPKLYYVDAKTNESTLLSTTSEINASKIINPHLSGAITSGIQPFLFDMITPSSNYLKLEINYKDYTNQLHKYIADFYAKKVNGSYQLFISYECEDLCEKELSD